MINIDDIDRRILTELSRNGRLSNTDLARRVGLSASACWTRVRALEDSGVIKGYSAVIDRALIGLPETIVVEVTLDKHKHAGDAMEAFGKAIERLPQVMEAAVVAGDMQHSARRRRGDETEEQQSERRDAHDQNGNPKAFPREMRRAGRRTVA